MLHSNKFYDIYSSTNFILVIKPIKMQCLGHVARMGDRRGAYRVLMRRPEGKRPIETPTCRWENNIKVDFEVG
jgi:hypothetical protein